MRPDEVTISQGLSTVREESISIPSVPAMPEATLEAEQFVPPVPKEAVLMHGEDEFIIPPKDEEANMLGVDEFIEPPAAGDVISETTADDLPDIPPVE